MEEGPDKKDWADPVTGEIFLLKLPSNEIMCMTQSVNLTYVLLISILQAFQTIVE